MAERCNLRYFLSAGMVLSGLFGILFGTARFFEIHSLAFFIVVQVAPLSESFRFLVGSSRSGCCGDIWRSLVRLRSGGKTR